MCDHDLIYFHLIDANNMQMKAWDKDNLLGKLLMDRRASDVIALIG